MSNNRANRIYTKSAKSDIKRIRLVHSNVSDADEAPQAPAKNDVFKSIHYSGNGILTERKIAANRNNSIALSLKQDNNVYSKMNYPVKEHGRRTDVNNVFLHTTTEVSRDAEARYLYGVLMQYINFGKNRDHIVEDDMPLINEYESLNETEKKDFINDLVAVSQGNKSKERHLTF
jgi:hypothetical protein